MRGIFSCMVILVLASGAMAAFMEYTGGSTVMTANDWYELNVNWDPTSTTGAPRWPTTGDQMSLRNGAVTQLNTFVEADELQIGGWEVLDTSGGTKQPMPASTFEIVSGGHLKLATGNQGLTLADEYDATMNIYPGGRLEMSELASGDGKAWWRVGYAEGLNAQMNIYGGTVTMDAGQYSNLYIGRRDSIGEVHQYDGLVDIHSPDKGYLYIGRDAGTGTGSYILEGGSFLHRNDTNSARNYIGRYGGTAIWKQTGGYSWFGGGVSIGSSGDGKGYSEAYASWLGGTCQMLSGIWFGGTDSSGWPPVGGGRITYGQDAVFQSGGALNAYSNWCELEFIIDSADDFSVYFDQGVNLNYLDIVVTLDGYTPTVGEQFVAMTVNPAADINLAGMQSVTPGWKVIDDDVNHQLILEYVPEPATLSLLALGGLALIRRRR